MKLEFHQLDRRYEHLRVRNPERQRRLLASLAASGQQTPIVVVAVSDKPDRYRLIDGHKRVAALEQLGRDTVEAVVWDMSEADALVLDRSMRFSEPETALEEGWLLQELEQRFGYTLEDLARRFDRSVSWVSRRLALVEQLPEAVQQRVRAGEISAHVAMKYLAPLARANPNDCQRMADAFAKHRFSSRQAGELYAAWRDASPSIRQRILDSPELFLKAHQQVSPQPSSPAEELLRDLTMVLQITNRASRRLARAAPLMGHIEFEAAQRKITAACGIWHTWPNVSKRSKSMLSQSQRTAILELHAQGVSKREIARVMNVSRLSVRKVLRSNSSALPVLVRPEKAEAYRIQILELLATHKHNRVRVHEELVSRGANVSYPALTAFCRRHGIGQEPRGASGHYHFEPGEELQHDTSPHETEIAGKTRRIQTASAVLCYSRMLFFQCYPTFQRFDCKVFLTDALRYFGGSTERVMIDNTHVVVLRGTGADMVPVPQMEAFGDRFGFHFAAHERGDANRNARVERPFDFIDNNFLAGRTFSSWEDLNQQARQWSDRVNSTYKKHIRAVPREWFAVERLRLKPLPVWTPEVYRLHERIVDVEGYVALHSSRYSVPVAWIGRRVEVPETKDKLEIQLDARNIVMHQRVPEGDYQRITLAQHRPPRGQGIKRTDPHPEEQAILQTAPELTGYVAALKKRGHRYLTVVLRRLLRILREYPRQPVLSAVAEAARYGLYDLDRLERMVLARVAREYFLLDEWKKANPHEDK